MKKLLLHPVAFGFMFFGVVLTFVTTSVSVAAVDDSIVETEPEKGPNRGRLLKQDGFVIELSIFETGVPPEFRVWVTNQDKPVAPE